MESSNIIVQSFLIEAAQQNGSRLNFSDLLAKNRNKNGGDFLIPLNVYLDILKNVHQVMFAFMDEAKKNQLRYDLQVTLLLLLAEKEYEYQHQKIENKKIYDKKIERCNQLLDALNPNSKERAAQAPEQAYFCEARPSTYQAIFLAQELVQMMEHKTRSIKEILESSNEKRSQWVRGSLFLKTILSLVSKDFFNVGQALRVIKAPDPYMGCLSWGLYYFYCSLDLFLLLKNTIKGPWMNNPETDLLWSERFQTEWARRKSTLLKNSISGTANLLCFFWLNGKSALETWGNMLTLMLLLFGITLALWDFEEQQAEYNREIEQFSTNIQSLEELIGSAEEPMKGQLTLQKNTLQRAKAHCEADWQYKKLILINHVAYALGSMLAFIVLTMPLIPVPTATAAVLGLVGVVLCFAFKVINNAIKGGIELYKTHQTAKELQAELNTKLESLRAMPKDDLPKRLLFLEIKKLCGDTEYQKELFVFQAVHLVRSLMVEILMPAVAFASLVFLPLGIGLGVLGAVLGMAIASHLLIHTLCKPTDQKEAPFDLVEYQVFCNNLASLEKDNKLSYFFKPSLAGKKPSLPAIEQEQGVNPSFDSPR